MTLDLRHLKVALVSAVSLFASPGLAAAAAPSAADALKLSPMQKGEVDYDVPAAAELAKCTIKAEKIGGQTGWVVRDPAGQILREFGDTNGDNVVDRWSYFRDGVEVYRDIDVNFNGKADQFRWLNTSGTRWGLDKNEDGKIDEWKMISAEEVTAEVVAALREKNAARFSRLLLSQDEVQNLGLGEARTTELVEKINAAPDRFQEIARSQKAINADTTFVNFGGAQPGVVPAGTNGSTNDLIAYENVVGMVDTAGKPGQVHIGTLVRSGDAWRLIDVPQIAGVEERIAASGFFFSTAARRIEQQDGSSEGPTAEVTKLLGELEKIDIQITKENDPAELTRLNDTRADLLERIAEDSDKEMKSQFLRQLADTVGAAVQAGSYTKGIDRLKALYEKLQTNGDDADLTAYVQFRFMTAEYNESLRQEDAPYGEIQEKWLENLEKFVEEHGTTPDAAEAMLQLAMAEEFAGKENKAKSWYGRIVTDFKDVPAARKAEGAIRRLESVGKTIPLRGNAVNAKGRPVVDLARNYKGKVVLIHYWATWCEPCKADLAQLKELRAKYSDGFDLVGVSLDTDEAALLDYLGKNRLPWAQLYEAGGLDSRLANELGIVTLPTMILVDDKGLVANRNIHITEVDGELKKLIKKK